MGSTPRFLAEPHATIVDAVAAVEPDLSREVIARTVSTVADTRAKARRLAQAVHEEPQLLTSQQPRGPLLIELLIVALHAVGAQHVMPPLCARCNRPKGLKARDPNGSRICLSCALTLKRNATRANCSKCGKLKHVVGRDLRGGALCAACATAQRTTDYLPILLSQLDALQTGLTRTQLEEVTVQALPQPFQRRNISGEIDTRPDILYSNPALGSHRLVVLTQMLLAAGACGIAPPVCPLCGSLKLSGQCTREGIRCCNRCYENARRAPCSRCQQLAHVVMRTPTGEPLCQRCSREDPMNHEHCDRCHKITVIARRQDGRRLCRTCWQGLVAVCAVCGQTRRCYFANTDAPRCEKCSSRLRPKVVCSGCGEKRNVTRRSADGAPVCGQCARARERCITCGRTRPVIGRAERGALCRTCYSKHSVSFRNCIRCECREHLYRFGLCITCAADEQLHAMFTDSQGNVLDGAEPVIAALAASDPASLLNWIYKSSASQILEELVKQNEQITHELLDKYRHDRSVPIMRAALVAGGLLALRDEYLARIEHWLKDFCETIDDPAHRTLIRNWGSWNHLRRYRHQSRTQSPVTYNQVAKARGELILAKRFLDRLAAQNITLGTCSQADIDAFLADGTPYLRNIRGFLMWAAKTGEAPKLIVPYRETGKARTPVEADHRWKMTKHLLHQDDLESSDRLAGLLILLYGQRVSSISKLTTSDLCHADGKYTLNLGTTPLELPTPLDQIAQQTVEQRQHHIKLGRANDDSAWIFPGGLPGTPLSAPHLAARLKAIGISPRPSRNAALIDLAARMPAVILSKLLGVHISTATKWSEIGAQSYGNYAAQRIQAP